MVELIVTITVAGIFIGAILAMSGAIINIAVDTKRFEMASNLAYNNLRLYANGEKANKIGFQCNGDDAGDTETVNSPFTDTSRHPNKIGQTLLTATSTASIYNLPGPVAQTVTASAPYGCGNNLQSGASGATSQMPIRIVSTVTYGPKAKKVVHATYIEY